MALETISIGIDRSSASADALQWASDLAMATGAGLLAITSWQMPLVGLLPESIAGLPTPEVMVKQCDDLLRGVIAAAGPAAPLETVVVEGKPGPSLVAESAVSDLLVVGRTGQGKRHGASRFAEIVLGSTARHCIHHATTPIAAVPESSTWSDSSVAVVGLDGSASAEAALAWALTNLPLTCEIRVMRAFAPWVGDGLYPMDLVTETEVHDSIRRETQDWVDTIVERLSPFEVETPAVDVMIASARDALVNPGYEPDVIVVGERGATGISAMVLGSVSDHVVRYASCPVIIVPASRS